MNARVLAAALALALVGGTAVASAEPPGAAPIVSASAAPSTVFEVDASSIGFTPGTTYGPWQFLTLSARTTAGPNDKPGVLVVTRADHDSALPTSGTLYSIDDYHTFSPTLSAYAQLQASSGTIFPRRGAYLELDPTVRTNLVVAVGSGELVAYDGLLQRYLNVGPVLYFPHGNATVRYVPLWTQGQVSASSLLGTLELGDEGRTTLTLTVQDGVEPAFDVGDPFVAATTQERVAVADLTYRHWLNPRFGYLVSGELGSTRNRFGGSFVSARRGLTLGVFFGAGHAAAPP
jgi:YaiO family outer membrane protein